MTPSTPGVTPGSKAAASPLDIRRRAHARLAERIDFAKSRHKPQSLVRQDARRTLEQFLDQDAPTLSRSDRDRLVEDVLAATAHIGVLDDLFRDDGVQEIMVLSPTVVLARKAEWLPTSARFRDADQWRAVLARYAEIGENQTGDRRTGGLDVRLANGFRVTAVLPPLVMEQPPVALFVRGTLLDVTTDCGLGATTPVPKTNSPGSGAMATSEGRVTFSASATTTVTTTSASNRYPRPPAAGESASGRHRQPAPFMDPPVDAQDPFAKLRQRVTERIITTFAGAGVYDLNAIPLAELRRIIAAAVYDFCATEKLGAGDTDRERLTLEILAGMNR